MLLLSLCYQPTDNTITISIIKARDLKSKDINGLSGAPRRIESRIIRRIYCALVAPATTISFILHRGPFIASPTAILRCIEWQRLQWSVALQTTPAVFFMPRWSAFFHWERWNCRTCQSGL